MQLNFKFESPNGMLRCFTSFLSFMKLRLIVLQYSKKLNGEMDQSEGMYNIT